jgi:antitoxin VapB
LWINEEFFMETAKLLTDGCRQTVLLPEAYRFHGNEVYIKKITEGLLLIPKDRSVRDIWEDESVRNNKGLNLIPLCYGGGLPESDNADRRHPAENLFSPEAVVREIKQTLQNPETVHSDSGLLAQHLSDSPEISDPCFNVEEWNREWDRIETKMERDEFAETEVV